MKAITSLTIDVDVLIEAKRRKLNLSKVFTQFLRETLNIVDIKEDNLDILEQQKLELQAKMGKIDRQIEKVEKKEAENRPVYKNVMEEF